MEIRLVHMGDSITIGQYCDPALRWTALLESLLAGRFAGGGVTITSFNSGISGNTTRQGLERYPADVQELVPQVLTLQFGMNDCNCWATDCGVPRVSEAAFQANLVEMVARARHFGAREVIMATNPCSLKLHTMPSGEVYETANARYSQLLREVALEVGVTLCDVRAGFERLSEQELAGMLLPDLIHMSIAGNAFFADLIAPSVVAAVEAVVGEAVLS